MSTRDRADRLLACEVFKPGEAARHMIPVTAAEGRNVWVGPHDIFRGDQVPVHKDYPAVVVHVDAVVTHGAITVLMCHDPDGAAVYDTNDFVEEAA